MGSSGAADAYEIEKSLRFNSGDSTRLDRAISSAGDVQRWTFSCWLKRGNLDTDDAIWFQGDAGANRAGLQLSSHRVSFIDTGPHGSGGTTLDRTSARVLRDPTRWYHVLIQLDSTNATAQDRCKLYLDGELQVGDLLAVNTTFAQSTNGLINSTVTGMRFGANPYNTAYSKADVYLAEVHFISGSNVSIDTFGETNAKGNWVPKEVTGVTYGTNGFYLDFKDSSSLGNDAAGSNNFTPTNFSSASDFIANDLFADSPTANYATLNPLQGRGLDGGESGTLPTFTQGNLHVSGGQTNDRIRGTIGLKLGVAGKYYFEVKAIGTPASSNAIGFQDEFNRPSNQAAGYFAHWSYNSGNDLPYKESGSNPGWTAGDILGVAINTGTSKVTWYKNNTSAGVSDLSSSSMEYVFPYISANSGVAFAANFGGNGSFNYTPPADHVPITIQNLPEPTIADPTDHFNTILYTGNNNTSQNITGVGFQPDLVWVKNRDNTERHHLVDSVRGDNKVLMSNVTDAERTGSHGGGHTQLNLASDGFNLVSDGSNDELNFGSRAYAAWNWKESATAGFDIVSYTGNGSAGNTVSHSLGVAPDLMIIKNRTTAGPHWFIYMRSMGNTTWIPLDTNSTANTSVTDTLNSTSPTSSIFTLGNNNKVNASSTNYIAYLWTAIEGFSRFWYYTGNGNADGPFVYTGFKPAFIIAKNTATTNYWRMWNNKSAPINPVATGLYPNDTAVEDAPVNWTVDWLSNGFKVRNDDGEMNGSGQDIIFWAWAEEPFKYSTAR